jgi:hypothetical protein
VALFLLFSSFMARMASSCRMAPVMSWLKVKLWKGMNCSWILVHRPLWNMDVFFASVSMWFTPYYGRYMNLLQYLYIVPEPNLRSRKSCCLRYMRPSGMW